MSTLATRDVSTSTAASTRQPGPTVAAASASDQRKPAREQAIRERAYAIWEEEGRPDGRDLDHWRRAEEEIGLADEVAKD
jgi:Protein of unknown function (DUF2934)